MQCDRQSQPFAIRRGTKQGDPISPILFNAVLEDAMRKAKQGWIAKGYGIRIGPGGFDYLSNLRFADDILLTGDSLEQITEMLCDLEREAGKVGLELHAGKTKILRNSATASETMTSVQLKGQQVQVLGPDEGTMYLGRLLQLTEVHDTELRHRLGRAWGKFAQHRAELVDKKISLHKRLRLFNAVVTPTVLYGSGCWAMTKGRDTELRTAQRKMLRAILGKG